MEMVTPPSVRRISTSTVRPSRLPDQHSSRCHLTPWDLTLLSIRYIQKGLLFYKLHSSFHQTSFLDHLKNSLSHALFHFFPLAGRLTTDTHSSSLSISIDCNGSGAEFIHAVASHLTVSDIVDPVDVPSIVQSFCPYNGAVCFDGCSIPLLGVQLTELEDGFFLGCSFNHVVGDGSSFWHFFSSWSEIFKSGNIPRPPVTTRWFPDNVEIPIRLPFEGPDQFIERFPLSTVRDRFFHFSRESISRLKARANDECKTDSISSFQALSAHVWRAMTRARGMEAGERTSCLFSIDTRARMKPPLPREYFGNAIQCIGPTTTVGELLNNGLGWAAWKLHSCVADYTCEEARRSYETRMRSPVVITLSGLGVGTVLTGSSPRFDVYGVDFGWGKAVAVRTGQDNKLNGKITAFPGREGGGSVDLEICLAPELMVVLEMDMEFMAAVSPIQISSSR